MEKVETILLYASLKELVAKGQLGPVALGTSREVVKRSFGLPERVSGVRLSNDQPAIWKYGDIELHFGEDDGIWLVHLDYFQAIPQGGGSLLLDAWIFQRNLSRAAAQAAFQAANLPYEALVDSPWSGPSQIRTLVGRGVELTWELEAQGEVLVAISYSEMSGKRSTSLSGPSRAQ